jgi:site-specific DNA-methyltransferase (adenine-specific)
MIYLRLGGCLEVMKTIEDNSIDAIITDPPYGTTDCKWDSIIDFELMWEQLNRIIKSNGAIVLFGSEPFSSALRMSNIKNYKYDIVWEKPNPSNPLLAKKRFMSFHENISIFYKKAPTYNPQKIKRLEKDKRKAVNKHYSNPEILGGKVSIEAISTDGDLKHPSSVLKYNREQGLHPTQKPLPLIKMLVKSYTNKSDWVLDNTCGSNSTGIACYDLNRNYIGIEKDIDIYNVAKKRVEKNILLRANKPKTLFEAQT